MVKKDNKTSISEEDIEDGIINENGKRTAEGDSKDRNKRVRTKSLYRQPTVKELNRLQETENLFNSNLFRLQIEEILQEVKVKEKTEKKFQHWFTEFKNYLESIPEDNTEYDLSESIFIKKIKVKWPVNSELQKTKCIFKFYKFKNVDIVGSYSTGCSINSKLKVDIQITVPADTYTKNDSINYRYHKKRAAYMAYIAAYLSKLDIIDDLKYSWLYGCQTKPVLDVKPAGKLGNYLSVHINLICESESYKLHRFSPARNNLRESWLFATDNTESNTDIGPATPYYNSSVLSDLTASSNQELLNEILPKSDNLKQAVVLLKIWLRQRKLQVSGHLVSMIVLYFVQTKRVNNIMSSYQIVRNIWIAIKASDWITKGISLHKGSEAVPTLEEFHKYFPVVFIDKTGYYNLCWQMTRGTYMSFRRECELAVDMLDNVKLNSFIPLFMTPVKPLMQFDHILRFKNLQEIKSSVLMKATKETKLNYGVDELPLVMDSLYSLLVKGLGNRVDLIQPLTDDEFSWSVKKCPEKVKREGCEEKLSFGLILNPDNAVNILDKGPPANLPEADEFRAFWGDKSELRRFQDGSITETCVWEGETAADKRTITKQILNYLLNLKFDVKPSELFHVSDQLDSVLVRKHFSSDGSAECLESSVRALQAFDELRTDLRQLTRLPLSISALHGVSSVFSYTCPIPPLPMRAIKLPWRKGNAALIKNITTNDGLLALPEYVPVCKAIVELEHSGKWPGDIEAFRCLKAAFHLQISDRLSEQCSLTTQAAATHLDVLKNGLVFRLTVAHPKEITLMRREIENGVVKHRENEETVKLQCETVLLPRLRGALHGLHQKHSAFGPTACLLKRWLSSHLLSPPHFPEVVAELVTAAVFLHCRPGAPPVSPTLGLMRVLRLLAETDWLTEVIVLDFNEDMTREEITEIEQKFSSGSIPGPCMRIVTAYDDATPGVWCSEAPSLPVLVRVQKLADSALCYVENALMTAYEDNLLGVFVPSYSGYDVLIHLHSKLVPHVGERVDKPAQQRYLPKMILEDVIPVVEFHPVLKYLDELRNAYSDFALFFHDRYGGEVIAVLWKPDLDDFKEFQLSNANALMPVVVEGETKYKVNKDALLEDFKVMGRGLAKYVTVVNS